MPQPSHCKKAAAVAFFVEKVSASFVSVLTPNAKSGLKIPAEIDNLFNMDDLCLDFSGNNSGGKPAVISAEEILSKNSYRDFKIALAGSNCRLCALSGSRTRIVADRGSDKAKILVIGEAPGATEDKEGKAFVGRAGKTFDKVMASIGLDTNRDMLICNVVKCRPPGNRRPKEEEAKACRRFLLRQIEFIRPKAIILLGATAFRHICAGTKKFSMGEEAGKFFNSQEFPGISFMVMYHPAALLYNVKLKPAMEEHAAKLKTFMEGENIFRA